MTPKHHPSEELILAYAAGSLDEATSVLIASHLALCPACRSGLETAETLAGMTLQEMPPVSVSEAEVDAMLARIGHVAPAKPANPPVVAARPIVLPQPLRDYVGGDVDTIRWRGLGGGVRQFPVLKSRAGAVARLLRIPPGARVPEHSHGGLELTLVLSGSFYDRNAWFRRGDLEETDATVEHQPVAGPEEPCICLAVTDSPLRFRGLLPRLAQPFLDI